MSKTRAEVEYLAAGIAGTPIFIVENGGELVVPAGHSPKSFNGVSATEPLVVELGVRRELPLTYLADITHETGARLRAFAHLSLAETMALTGLSETMARLARERRYDEPFLVEQPGRLPAIVAAASRRGLRVTHGGRWHHLTGDTDKGMALNVLRQRLVLEGRRPFNVGLGDAANDLSFLRLVDRPIVIPRPDGIYPGLVGPAARRTCATSRPRRMEHGHPRRPGRSPPPSRQQSKRIMRTVSATYLSAGAESCAHDRALPDSDALRHEVGPTFEHRYVAPDLLPGRRRDTGLFTLRGTHGSQC